MLCLLRPGAFPDPECRRTSASSLPYEGLSRAHGRAVRRSVPLSVWTVGWGGDVRGGLSRVTVRCAGAESTSAVVAIPAVCLTRLTRQLLVRRGEDRVRVVERTPR